MRFARAVRSGAVAAPALRPADLKPKELASLLDSWVVGQSAAKRVVAVALRTRWRRAQLLADPAMSALAADVVPKNILMIGPTGVGKSEIARRIAQLSDAPFIRVEATAFTEVGFHGKDVDTIIKDLVEVAIGNERAKRNKAPAATADNAVIEDALLDALLGPNFNKDGREAFRKLLRQGVLEDREITVELPRNSAAARSGEAEHGLPQDMIVHLFSVVGEDGPQVNKKTVSRKTTVREARSLLAQAQAGNEEDLVAAAIRSVEENGIVVLDEIDKVCVSRDGVQYSGDASSEGVQRDLLPLIEGTRVTTKHGDVNTAKVLFIAAGAFTACKPSDLLAELQGRLPVRVELAPLSEADLHRILTETKNNLIAQQVALLATEGIQLTVEPAAVRRMAAIAHTLNTTVRNIGARRLHTVVEAVFEDVSFECAPGPVTVDVAMVEKRLASLMTNVDLRKSLL